MSSPLQPLAGYIVAQTEEAQSKTASGLYLPDNATEKPKIAKVIAIGKDVTQVQVNDRVVYGGYSNTQVKIEKQEYILVKEEDILAVVK